jgi:hypothetical protein
MIKLLVYTPVVDFEESPIKAKFIVMWTLNTKGTRNIGRYNGIFLGFIGTVK